MRTPKLPVIILALVAAMPAVAWAFRLRVNITASLPLGLYIATAKPSDYVEFCPAEEWEKLALDRHYVTPGYCPGGGIPLLKLIVARSGDIVTLDTLGLSVNGRLLPNTEPRLEDSAGRPMRHYPFGGYSVAAGEVWVASCYDARSMDSRYYGPIAIASIRLHLRPLFIQEARCR